MKMTHRRYKSLITLTLVLLLTAAASADERESYTKHAKTFVYVGEAAADDSWSELVGMFLEIVPEKNPTTLRKDDDFSIRVLRNGAAFANFAVGIICQGNPKPSFQTTDEAGRASFRLSRAGKCLLTEPTCDLRLKRTLNGKATSPRSPFTCDKQEKMNRIVLSIGAGFVLVTAYTTVASVIVGVSEKNVKIPSRMSICYSVDRPTHEGVVVSQL